MVTVKKDCGLAMTIGTSVTSLGGNPDGQFRLMLFKLN